jgi:uncharacterized protein with HEPN domain
VTDDKLYLIHIRECIERIRKYTASGRDVFMSDGMIQDAVVRNLQLLAESTLQLSDGLKQRYPQIDWRGIKGFRNVVVHDYLGIDIKRVWDSVEHDLDSLKAAVDAMLADIKGD